MIHAWRGGWSRQELVDGVYPVDTGAVRDACLHVLRELGVIDVREDVRGKGVQRELVPMGP